MRKLIPVPGLDDRQAGLTFAEVANSYPWRGPAPRPEELRRLMLAIGDQARLLSAHLAADPTEKLAVSLHEAEVSLRAINAFDPREAADWLVDVGSLQLAADIGDELQAFQIAVNDEQCRIAGQFSEITALARELRAGIENFQRRHEAMLKQTQGDENPLRREFILSAARAWRTTTGRAPGTGKTGPFARFCTVAWEVCELEMPAGDLYTSMGASISRYLPKLPQHDGE